MKYARMLSLAAIAAASLLILAGSASATTLTNGSGVIYGVGTVFHAVSEGTTTLHAVPGDITCGDSTAGGQITNAGGTGTVSGPLESFTLAGCNVTVHVLKKGVLEIHTKTASADGNGTLTSTGMELTAVISGFDCIFTTNSTDLGTVTGSKTISATLDIEATIPRTGGSAFCGSTGIWTGFYKFDKPTPLYID